MYGMSDPADMITDDRQAELAGLLASGFIRMRSHKGYVPLPVEAAEQGSESFADKLSESAGCVRPDEAQCQPRGGKPTRKGR